MNKMTQKMTQVVLSVIMMSQPMQVTAQAVEPVVKVSADSSVDADPLSSIVALPVAAKVAEEVTEPVVEAPKTAQEILLEVCEAAGYGEDCAKALLGMMWKESNNIANAVGDRGKALGYFQIHYKMHKVSEACATDLKCSAEWSLKYMERNKYPKYVNWAVQCHNGCGINNGYAASALRHGVRLWNQPLAVTTASQLALK